MDWRQRELPNKERRKRKKAESDELETKTAAKEGERRGQRKRRGER